VSEYGGRGGIRAQNHHFLEQVCRFCGTIQAYFQVFFVTRHCRLLTLALTVVSRKEAAKLAQRCPVAVAGNDMVEDFQFEKL
jgi:hypothetical protein